MDDNNSEFFRAVVEMRKRQKLYFKTRDPVDLESSKSQERFVDTLIKDNGQKHLFEDE